MRHRHWFALSLSTSLFFGCGGSSPHRFNTIDEAGTFGVAVLSVEDWESFKTDAQPHFTISADEARAAVLPNTKVSETQLVRTLHTLLKAALPTVTSSEATTANSTSTSTDSGGATSASTSTTEVKQTSKSGDVSAVTTPTSAPSGLASNSPQSVLGPTVGTDPHIQYLAATALYQYVQVLNHYVTNAISRKGYRPVVATLQVSLQPTVNNAPYDAYATLLVSPHQKSSATPPPKGEGIVVIPLLNTDNLEGELASRSDSRAVDFALGILASINGIGLSGEVAAELKELRKTLGHKYNSLLSVSRLGDSVLRVRMGSQTQGEHAYMVSRTHLIPLLVLVPCDVVTNDVDIMSRVDFVDNDTGEPLGLRTTKDVEARLVTALAENGVPSTICRDTQLWELYRLASQNRLQDFKESLEKCTNTKDANYYQQVALDLLRVRAGSAYASATFPLPLSTPVSFSNAKVSPLVDDGKTGKLRITNLDGVRNAQTEFWMSTSDSKITLQPDAVTTNVDGTSLSLTFPSAAALKLSKDTVWKLNGFQKALACPENGQPTQPSTLQERELAYIRLVEDKKAETAAPVITLKLGNPALRPTNGKATLGIKVERTSKGLMDPIIIKASFKRNSAAAPGTVVAATNATDFKVEVSPLGTIKVTPTGTALSTEFQLTLEQLEPNTEITFSVESGSLPTSAPQTATISGS